MPRDDLLLTENQGAIGRIVDLVGRMDTDDPANDPDLVDALLWNFTVLGEAANGLSEHTKLGNTTVDWADPVRLRNRIVHGYWSIDLDVLVSTARDDPLSLLRVVDEMLEIR